MLSYRMVCGFCRNEIPEDSFRLVRSNARFESDLDEEIECPHCKILNDVYRARCRANK